jgi:DNA integrity scanning protein DisA with diadenylate cyclase activity
MQVNEGKNSIDDGDVHLLCLHGDLNSVVDKINLKGTKKNAFRTAIEILMGLSLKGYEGRAVGALYLVGDIEGIRRNSTQMIINPFKGWKDINIGDPKQLPTIESFTQMDGAMVFDSRGFAHYAGRMINVRESECEGENPDFERSKGKGSGTRWRAARYITMKTRTIAVTLSSNGTITVFKDGNEIGVLERRMCSMRSCDVPLYLYPRNEKENEIRF